MARPDRTSQRKAVIGLFFTGILVLLLMGDPAWANRVPASTEEGGVVYLTFDDGPHPMYTPMILDILERYGARGTFFPLGRRLEERWEIEHVQDLLNRGHAVGNHSWDHPRLTELKRVEIRAELNQASVTIEERTGYRPRCFRAPYGEVDTVVLEVGESLGMEHVGWDADPQEWRSPSVAKAFGHIRDRLHDGLVVLMHDRKWMTLPILAEVLRELPADQWRFEALPQCEPGGNPIARMVTSNNNSSPVGAFWETVSHEHKIRTEGWAYHPRFPDGGLVVTVNATGKVPTVGGVTGPDHRFSVISEGPASLIPACVWIGEPDRLGYEAFLGCRPPVGLAGN